MFETAIGTVGVLILLIFFILNQLKIMSAENIWYDLGNLVGASLLVVYAYLLWSIPFLILESVWALFSLREVINDLRRK